MTDVWFYHLERASLEDVLPGLLGKSLERGWRALVRTGSAERLQALDAHLWTYRDDSFLPHGTAQQAQPEDQPVLLTTGTQNLNSAKILFLADDAEAPELDALPDPENTAYERILVLFDGRDEAALTHARARWKAVKATGADLSYWQQTTDGRWDKKA